MKDTAIRSAGHLPYLLFQPDSAAPTPLVLFLHGAGERGDDLEKVRQHSLPRLLEHNNPFTEAVTVIAPQCPANSWWTLELDKLELLLDAATSNYSIDTSRLYLTGLSMGGYGVWHLALKQPERFAALVPICGGGIPPLAHKLSNMPIWAFHGSEDKVVPLSASQKMVDAVNESGGHAKLTVYDGVGHNSWNQAYGEAALYPWLLRQNARNVHGFAPP